jgi:hypothetical protein
VREIAPRVWHWTTFHEGIGSRVSSYFIEGEGRIPHVIVDPRVPEEGLAWFRDRPPAHALLTNRHHYRHAGEFAKAFGTKVHAHRAGLHEFTRGEAVHPFDFGDELPGGVKAVAVASLCDEETAFHTPRARSLAHGDSVVRAGGRGKLSFVPDDFMGRDPEAVKRGLRAALEPIAALDWDNLLLAHGEPWTGDGRAALATFVAGRRRRAAA